MRYTNYIFKKKKQQRNVYIFRFILLTEYIRKSLEFIEKGEMFQRIFIILFCYDSFQYF